MEFLAILLVIGALFAVATALNYVAHQRRRKALQSLATRLERGSAYVDDGLFADLDGARVQGRLQDHDVRVRYRTEWRGSGKNRHKVTFVRCHVKVRDPITHRFKVERAGLLKKVGRFFGLVRDVKTGDQRIDDKYILNGRADALGQLFTQPEVERALDALLSQHGFAAVELAGTDLQVEKRSTSTDPAWLLSVLRNLIQVARLCDRKPVEVKVLGPKLHFAWTAGGQDALCPYCRDTIDPEAPDLTACDRCDTVHHTECLDEAGGCTVFGCGGGRARQRVR